MPLLKSSLIPASRFLLLFLALLTASCTTYHRANPTDQLRPQPSLPPSQRPYTVNGTRYEPLSSHAGFEEEGIASSYGADFHGRTTSNGETFDMNAMTAAHKTLPLGVFVKVRHLKNGREVVVRINDRGPFVKDRIIDLSEAAAGNLDMLRDGIAPVRIIALGYRLEGSGGYRQPMDYDNGTFSLQVGSFTVKANAYRYAEELKKRYGTADVREAVINGSLFYRVRLGRYGSLREAESKRQLYERSDFRGCFVVATD